MRACANYPRVARDSTPNQKLRGARLGVLVGWGLLLPVLAYPLRRSSVAGQGSASALPCAPAA